MSDDSRSCPSCGAHVPPDAAACDLCGTPVDDAEASADDPPPDEASTASAADPNDPPSDEADEGGVYCHQCGWENPPDANYCSQCGTELQDVPATDAPAGTRPVTADLPQGSDAPEAAADEPTPEVEQAEMGQRILMVVGTAVLLVLGLFFLTQWSQQYDWGSDSAASDDASATQQPPADGGGGGPSRPAGSAPDAGDTPSPQSAAAADPTDLSTLVNELGGAVEGPVADKIDSLRAAVEDAQGDRERTLKAQLADLYVGAGTPGRAALVQAEVADQSGRVEDRRRAADLLYRWMRRVEQEQGRARVADVARHVAEAYAAVVEERPQDLDARTRMGEAYLLTNNPMKGIRAINQVLEDDPSFVPARFQKGLALLQINRLDEAVSQFEKVMEAASQDDPFYQQAKRAIEVIREQSGSSGQRQSAGS